MTSVASPTAVSASNDVISDTSHLSVVGAFLVPPQKSSRIIQTTANKYIIQDFPSEAYFMESKIRPVQYNQLWCVYVHRKRAYQKGATQELGFAPPVRSSSTSVFFSSRAAIPNSRSSSSSSSSSHIEQHQYRASTSACISSSSSRSIAATVITGKCYNSNNIPVPGTYLCVVQQHTWYKYRALYC